MAIAKIQAIFCRFVFGLTHVVSAGMNLRKQGVLLTGGAMLSQKISFMESDGLKA